MFPAILSPFLRRKQIFYRKAWLSLRSEFSRRHLPRMMAEPTQSQWKNFRFPSRARFSRKNVAQFVRLPAARGLISRAAIVGWNSRKCFAKHLSVQALAFLCIFIRVETLIFQLGAALRRPRPENRSEMTESRLHNPLHRHFERRNCEESFVEAGPSDIENAPIGSQRV